VFVHRVLSFQSTGELFERSVATRLNYGNDERVIALITHGIGSDARAPLIRERCEWIEAAPEGE